MAKRCVIRRWATGLLVFVAVVAAQPVGAGRDRSDPLALLSARSQGGRGIPTEAEWARDLTGALGLDVILPDESGDDERFALLCADHVGLVGAGDGRRLPGPSPLRVAVPAPDAVPGRPLRMVVQIPETALYLFSVEGVGLGRWHLNGRLVGHLDPSILGVAQAPAILPLRRGPYELSGTLAPQARADRVEIAAHRSLCIAPADGWHADRPLRYGVLARTLVQVLGMEGELPAVGGGIPVEGENYVESSGGGERSQRRLLNDPTQRSWARASHGPAEFVYRVVLETPGLFSLEARLPGGGAQLWSVDDRYRATLRPRGSKNEFSWNSVLTLPLASGRHVVRVLATQGSGIDRMRLVPRTAEGSAYVAALGRAGFPEGAADAPVTRRVARSSLDRMLETPGAERFLTRYADGTGRRPPADPAGPRMTGPDAPPSPTYRPEAWR